MLILMTTTKPFSDSSEQRLQAENELLRLHLATIISSAENLTYRTLADFYRAIQAAKEAIEKT